MDCKVCGDFIGDFGDEDKGLCKYCLDNDLTNDEDEGIAIDQAEYKVEGSKKDGGR